MNWKILALGIGIAIALPSSSAKGIDNFEQCMATKKEKTFGQCMKEKKDCGFFVGKGSMKILINKQTKLSSNPPPSPERGSKRQKPR